ncbi:transporter substrate-binding protein [Streptomyces albidoflavus]|uniref:transporter substrate-binding protein n=1 Tax=Streptomyces albidoflavus TaxID=1886 RepID=UPI001F0B9926|nr:transporter substrate-binding protein [Streptomyces albidoflavus]
MGEEEVGCDGGEGAEQGEFRAGRRRKSGTGTGGDQNGVPGVAGIGLAENPHARAAGADAVFNTPNGDGNVAFFEEYTPAGLTAKAMPVLSVSITEEEVKSIGPQHLKDQLTAWNYHQTTETGANTAFVAAYKAKYGEAKPTSDPMEAAYTSVYLWKGMVGKARSFDPEKVRAAAELLALPVAFLVAGVLGVAVIIDAFLVIVAGGIGRLRGCVVAAFVLGVLRGAYGSGGTPAAVRARSGPRTGYGHFPGAHQARNGHRSAPRNRLPLG